MSKLLITANIFSDALAPLINIFDSLLVAIHSVVGSWGFSIMAMTLMIRARRCRTATRTIARSSIKR